MEHAYRWTDENEREIAVYLQLLVLGVAFLSLVLALQRSSSKMRTAGYVLACVVGMYAASADLTRGGPKGRFTAVQNACINNLRLIDSAKQQWAQEYHKDPHDTPASSDLTPYLGRGANGELPSCPTVDLTNFEANYNVGSIDEKPTCKIVPNRHILP